MILGKPSGNFGDHWSFRQDELGSGADYDNESLTSSASACRRKCIIQEPHQTISMKSVIYPTIGDSARRPGHRLEPYLTRITTAQDVAVQQDM